MDQWRLTDNFLSAKNASPKKIHYLRKVIKESNCKNMKLSSIATLIGLSIIALTSCKETPAANGPQPEELLGSFEYDGNTYGIRSVVVYELGNDTQLWISETAGYKTVDEIEKSIGELVITVPNSKLGGQKETFEQKGNFIRYDEKENSGICMVSCAIDKASGNISFEFSSQALKTGATNAIAGRYSGPYSAYNEQSLANEWAYNRKKAPLTSAEFIEMEDGSPSRFILYSSDYEAIDFTIAADKIGKTVSVSTNNVPAGTSVLFDDGEEFKLKGSYGSIKVSIENETMTASLSLTNEGGKTLRAEYAGDFNKSLGNKFDRCIFHSGSDGYGYNGKFFINDMAVTEDSHLTFRFTPGAAENQSTMTDGNLVPTLRISRSMINKGKIDLSKTEDDWSFTYHTFQVYSYDASQPDRTTAAEGSTVSVNKGDNGQYEIDLEVSYPVDKVITRDKVDENGNIVYTEVHKTDEFGTPLYDADDNPIMEKVPVKEQVTIQVPTTIDLYYNSSTSNDK